MFQWLKSIFAGNTTLKVSIPITEQLPSEEEMATLMRMVDAIERKGVKGFVGAGGGFGELDMEYDVSDPDKAKQVIGQVIGQYMPGKEFRFAIE